MGSTYQMAFTFFAAISLWFEVWNPEIFFLCPSSSLQSAEKNHDDHHSTLCVHQLVKDEEEGDVRMGVILYFKGIS